MVQSIDLYFTLIESGGMGWDGIGMVQPEHGGFDWMLLTYPDWTRWFMIECCWLTRVDTAACDRMLLTNPDWTRRFMIGRCWLTQTEHGGFWLDVVDLPRLNTTVYDDWTLLTYPDWTRRFIIGCCWLTQTEHGGLWLDVVDLPEWIRRLVIGCWLILNSAVCDWMLAYPAWRRRLVIGGWCFLWLHPGDRHQDLTGQNPT